MGGGARVELRIESPAECPVVDVAAATGGTGRSIAWSADPETGRTVEEFVLESDADGSDTLELPVETVFSDASSEIYRFDRDANRDCPCVSIERFGCPIANVEASDDALFVTFHVAEMDEIRPLLTELRSRYDGLSVERLIRSETNRDESNLLCIDRDVLTDRQIEVLRTALEMGYFERPRDATAGEVAAALEINRATFAEHLASAQRKLLPDIVGRREQARDR
ncbi:bacterio-opsin activator HTH domain-containing protein [Natronococcus amylolyticus DSM 10524]|uniref:Bacterio-opsin activator HTH domain-containing protein n=1 Tax=Natronococcus amylolyticus DSM 10524 TaxID=1227497 RepID=L9X2W5_9EURY|nr:helix-turn-helix domain-containing protein [Natronococcus amylolyticus]ELY56094.1 bacterio-opsin activator HTH domain-containing protein [Natronococcus amylolyticus DSM 10524]